MDGNGKGKVHARNELYSPVASNQRVALHPATLCVQQLVHAQPIQSAKSENGFGSGIVDS